MLQSTYDKIFISTTSLLYAFSLHISYTAFYVATVVAMVASALQLCIYWLIHKRFEKLHTITFLSILFLGGATLIFHNPIFIKWKPSIIYWVFSIILTGSHFYR